MNFKKTCLLLFLSIIICASCSERKEKYTIELDSNWEFMSEKETTFLPAKVPGTVHLDLINNNKIEDPFYRLNEHDLQWIDKLDWHYKTNFQVTEYHYNYENIELNFQGLDTYADVFLNDSLIYSSQNMFVGKNVAVKK